MLAQAKAMSSTWLDACGGGAVRVRFKGAKKRPAEVEELNAIFSNAVKAVLTKNTRKKFKASSNSNPEDKQDNFKF